MLQFYALPHAFVGRDLISKSTFSGFFSQKMYVLRSPKSRVSSWALMSNANTSLASVSLMIVIASFCPMHLFRPIKNGSYASSLSAGNGESARNRSGTKVSGCVKLVGDRNVGY